MISKTKLLQLVVAFLLIVGIANTKATAQIVENPQGVCDLLNRIGGEGTAERIVTIVDPTVGSSIREAFVVTSKDGKPCVKGSNLSALTTGINWYLNHYAHVKLFMYQHVTPVYMTVYMNKKVYTLIYTKIRSKSSDFIRLIGQRQLSV